MSENKFCEIYALIQKYYEKYLKNLGVKPINLRDKNGNFTKDALVLIYLAKDYPYTKIVSKAELTEFVRKFYPDTIDTQQARHLSKQKGYFIISGTRGDIGEKIPTGSYKLVSLEKAYPSFKPNRREGFEIDDFETLRKAYNYKCATCRSKQGEPHNARKNEIIKLQAGHIDPSKPLVAGNIIPQCQICNRPDRDRWIYDKTGRVIEIADSDDGRRVVEKYLKRISKETKEYFLKFLQRILKNKF